MSSNNPNEITPASRGFFHDLSMRAKLVLRLMGDGRVSPFLKLLPIGAVAFILWPIDVPGPFDDAAVVWLGTYMFVELCPPDVVQEHLEKLKKAPNIDWTSTSPEGEVIDGEFREPGETRSRPEETPR